MKKIFLFLSCFFVVFVFTGCTEMFVVKHNVQSDPQLKIV